MAEQKPNEFEELKKTLIAGGLTKNAAMDWAVGICEIRRQMFPIKQNNVMNCPKCQHRLRFVCRGMFVSCTNCGFQE